MNIVRAKKVTLLDTPQPGTTRIAVNASLSQVFSRVSVSAERKACADIQYSCRWLA